MVSIDLCHHKWIHRKHLFPTLEKQSGFYGIRVNEIFFSLLSHSDYAGDSFVLILKTKINSSKYQTFDFMIYVKQPTVGSL